MPLNAEIRAVLKLHARRPVDVDRLPTDADLYAAGMSSHASISVMLALEERFDVEFPDRMLRRNVFQSIDAIRSALDELEAQEAA